MRTTRIVPLLIAAAISAAGCDGPRDPSPQDPPRGAIVSGELQQDTVGDVLPLPLAVRVTDADGRALAGQTVSFTVASGGSSLVVPSARTDAAGETGTRWTLGTVAGDTQRVEARTADPRTGQPVLLATFRAVGLPDAPATITEGQLGTTAATGTCWKFEGPLPDFPCILTPAPVTGGHTWKQVSAGDDYTCGRTDGGVAYCWGRNDAGQVGNGSTAPAAAPAAVAGGGTYARISAGRPHACAVTTGGALRCWGDKTAGKLGTGTSGGSSTTPLAVPTPGGQSWRTVAAGDDQTCAVTTAGRAYCWGANGAGQLGDGTTTPRATPTLVQTTLTLVDVGAGVGYSCARGVDGMVICWGTNNSGRLGTGDAAPTRRPVPGPVRAVR